MNERFKEIARESGLLVHNPNKVPTKLEKFAELIVKECAQICKTAGGDQVSNASEDYQEGREMGAEVCHNMIKKHFGIEE